MVVRRELEELERESAPGAMLKPGRSPLKAKADKLEKSKALREAQGVGRDGFPPTTVVMEHKNDVFSLF